MQPNVLPMGIAALLVRLWRHLSRRRRHQFSVLMALVLLGAFAEVVSLGAVLPFIGVLVAPDRVFKQPIIANFARAFSINSSEQLVLPLTIVFAAAALIAGAIRLLLLRVSTRLVFAAGTDLSVDVYRRTLYQAYSVHVARNSSEVISGIVNKVSATVIVLNQLLILISSIVLLVAITLALLVINPLVATLAAVSFGGSYAVITWLSRSRLQRNSERIAYEETQMIKALQEGLGGVRDVLLDGTQPLYCEIYRGADHTLRSEMAANTFIAASPRVTMEALGMVIIATLAYGLSRQAGGVAMALPALGTLALGAQRLLPALQQGYVAWAMIAGLQSSLATTADLLDQPLPPELLLPPPAPLIFEDAIQFKDVRFRYTSEGPWVLDGVNFAIRKGARVGFVGATGSGKSTTLDILMGLLMPTEGGLLVDGAPIVGNRVRAWQQSIAHVPQSIYLADSTIAENIALGVRRESIDFERVKRAAQHAQIADFIESQTGGYNATVGERGVRLSGGQRQRIGIARALYKQARVLVFDEATSALDNATEQSVMDAIDRLNRDLTIVIIAHRLTTVRRCDVIVELEQGRVVAQGTYEQLLECSPSFRYMAREVA
jgi:ATP-binding cassette, subfamily B, bacterial PglK